jgi:hypothetical protein
VDLAVAHHGTYDNGAILFNVSLNGSNQSTHMSQQGYQDALLSMGNDLLMVCIANGLTSWDDSTETGATYVSTIETAIDFVRANSKADPYVIQQCEPAGFGGVLSDGTNLFSHFGAVTTPLIKAACDQKNVAFTSMYMPVGARSGQAVNPNGIDVWTWDSLIGGVIRDYVHGNRYKMEIYAKEAWKDVFSLGMETRQVSAPVTPQWSYKTDGCVPALSNSAVKTSILTAPFSMPGLSLLQGDIVELDWQATVVNFEAVTRMINWEITAFGGVVFSRGIQAAVSAGYSVFGKTIFHIVTAGATSEIQCNSHVFKDTGGAQTATLNDPSGVASTFVASTAQGTPITASTLVAQTIDIKATMPAASGLLAFVGASAVLRKFTRPTS